MSRRRAGHTHLSARRRELERQPNASLRYTEEGFFAGPLPPPEDLAKYEAASPGAADRIIRMAETQAAHRQAIEIKVVSANIRQQHWGPIMGMSVALAVIGAGVYLIIIGKEVTGLVALLGALASILTPFIYGKHKQQEELAQKDEELLDAPDDEEPEQIEAPRHQLERQR